VPGHHVNLVNLDFALQLHRTSFGDQTAPQLFCHDLHIRDGQAQLACDLPIGKVQAYEVKAQDPHPQRLVMPSQHRASEVVETFNTCLAPIALATWLRAHESPHLN